MSPRKKDPKKCACGCKGMTLTGDFLPGHDKKLTGRIINQVGGTLALKAIVEKATGIKIN